MATFQASSLASRPFDIGGARVPAAPAAPAGTFLPGTKVQVGSHRVIVDKWLSEGGFAHVYVVTLPKPIDGHEKAVLKRVAVPDKDHLAEMRTEVETMKRLKGQKYIVKYIDSHASPLQAGGYEVFLLMEWCNGGGLIDFMNTRLQNRLTEPEILKIFTDVAEGVASMHYLKPALMHRDLKVENVLISTDGKKRTFKVCDFGSAAVARQPATTAVEARSIEDDIQRHTTLQYRSPEMIDVYRKQAIDEKSDIWALGCFLYKLCYYTTPFEEVGQMAILNARFKYPGYPRFSDDLKLLIASMLQEHPVKRPNIFQVLSKAAKLDGRALTIKDIYNIRRRSVDARSNSVPAATTSQPQAGATLAPPKTETSLPIPQIEPMRRGRPLQPMSHHTSAKPSPSPLRMIDKVDAFSHLDGNNLGKDELSSKFPRLEEFSLITDKNPNFAFQQQKQQAEPHENSDLAKRVTEALADEAFGRSPSPHKSKAAATVVEVPTQTSGLQKTRSMENRTSPIVPAKPAKTQMVSIGTMTSPSLSAASDTLVKVAGSDRPIWRIPDKSNVERSASMPQASSRTKPVVVKEKGGSRLANLLQVDAAQSQPSFEPDGKSPTSSRPSLEGGRPLLRDLDSGVQRSKSLNMRSRPASMHIGSRLIHHGDHGDHGRRHGRIDSEPKEEEPESVPLEHVVSDPQTNIVSDLDFLRAREEEEREKHKHMHRHSSGSRHHQKRASLPSAAMSGTKNLLQGRFGEAFRKFEGHNDPTHQHVDEEAINSPGRDDHHILTPIAGSETTDLSDDRRGMDETEELSPELRRELEKQRLEAEERRVERAAAEYRQRIALKGAGPPPVNAKAASIQNRVQSLLKENDRPAQKTATGYGRFTAEADAAPTSARGGDPYELRAASAPVSAVDTQVSSRTFRPTAPPKPKVLRTGLGETVPNSRDLLEKDNWEEGFKQKYPDLSEFELVDDTTKPRQLRMKEV